MQRLIFLAYGVFCHLLFLGVYACLGVFVGGFDVLGIPQIDGPPRGSLGVSVLVDTLLIVAFGLQHSIMARPWFKERWTRFIPRPIERSTYVLASCAVTILLIWQWRPLGGTVWEARGLTATSLLWGLFALGWLAVPAASMLIDHFDLFGTRQVWLHFRRRAYEPRPFRAPSAYAYVRHPLYVGWFVALWATPKMTFSHLCLAGLLSAYILLAIPFEERDLLRVFGNAYATYRRRVGALVPRFSRRGDATRDLESAEMVPARKS